MSNRLFSIFNCCLLALACGTLPVRAQDAPAELPPGVRVVVNGHKLPADSYTIYVKELGAAAPLLAVNPELPLNPASTIKILTTLAALESLGPDYRWQTEFYPLGPVVDGTLQGDLLIKGGGDPFLVEEHFRGMLKVLQRRGVQRINGDLVIDASLFDPGVGAVARIDNDRNRSYNVLPHALMTNFQVVNFYFRPHANGRDVSITADPALPNLAIDNRLRLHDAACSGYQRGVAFSEDTTTATAIFSGQFPSRCSEYALSRAVLDAPNYAYGLFRKLWGELGGDFAGNWRTGLAPVDQEALVVWESPPLSDVIKSINKYSNNMMTRHLLLTLGLERDGAPATVAKGVAAIQAYLDRRGLEHATLTLVNGAGLSRDTRISSALLGAVLERGYSIPTMAEFIASLPLSGTDGTMRTRLRDNGMAGSMHIKTGTLDGVAGVAGYVHARSGKQFMVVALLNHPQADAGPGQELGDAVLAWVWTL